MASLDGPWSITNDECAGPTLHKGVKGDLKVEVAATFDHNNFTPERLRRLTYLARLFFETPGSLKD
jgi:hypothetical protein